MNSPLPDRQRDNKPYFMATLFNPAIVWDTSRLAIAQKMTNNERIAIAKRSTGILRSTIPEISHVLNTYERVRYQFAQTTIMQKLDNAGLLTEGDSRQCKRIRARAEGELEYIDTVTEKYRVQAGYRAACMGLLIADPAKRQLVQAAFEDLHLLSGLQQHLFQALLLKDLLHWSSHYAQSYTDFDVETVNAGYVKRLHSRIRTLGGGLDAIKTRINGSPVNHYLDNQRLGNPLLNGTDQRNPVVTVCTEFSLVNDCFQALNEKLATDIIITVNDCLEEAEIWELTLVDKPRPDDTAALS